MRFYGLGDGSFGHGVEVELGVLVLARAGLERRLAFAGDVEPAGVGRLDLVWARLGADQLRRPGDGGIAPPKPEEGPGDERGGDEHDQQRREHLARGNAARLILVLDSLEPGQLPIVIGRAIVAHRSTAFLAPGKPTTAQLKWIRSMRWHSTSEWACDVVPIWKR